MRSIRIAAAAFAGSAVLSALPASAGAQSAQENNNTLNFEWAAATPKKNFVLGGAVKFGFKLRGTGTRTLTVELVKPKFGRIRSFELRNVPTGTRRAVRWKGFNLRGKPVKAGRYYFRVRHPKGHLVKLAKVKGNRSFRMFPFIFPVRGPRTYGGASARFGAPRGGHRHQGHDVFAACRTKMVAPRAGTVYHRGYQAAAGHYLVLNLRNSPYEAVFMHLARRSPHGKGTKVRTGQQIGLMGQTGNASGCHLHFELWRNPGWYKGGRPFDPLPLLRRWASWG